MQALAAPFKLATFVKACLCRGSISKNFRLVFSLALTILIRSHHFKPSRYSTTHSLCFHQNYHDIASFHATSQPARTCPDEPSSVIANIGGRIFLQSPVPPGREHLSRRAFGSRGQSEQCSYTEPANAKKRIDPSGVGSCWHGPSHHTSHHLIFVPSPKGYRWNHTPLPHPHSNA